jgi:hypothetical protein
VVTEIPPQTRLTLPELGDLGLRVGRWTMTVDADTDADIGAGAVQPLQVWVDGDRVEPTTALSLPGQAEVAIVNPGSAAVHLRAVRFVRQADPDAHREALR